MAMTSTAQQRDRETRRLSDGERRELNWRYWDTDEPRHAIEERFNLTPNEFNTALRYWRTGSSCPRCESPLVWRSRLARRNDDGQCSKSTCPHRAGRECWCEPCESEARAQRLRLRDEWLRRWTPDSLDEAMGALTVPQKLVVRAAVSTRSLDPARLAFYAGVQERWVDFALHRLRQLGLVFFDGRFCHLHPELERIYANRATA